MAHYQLTYYAEALIFLRQLQRPDLSAAAALAVSEMIEGNPVQAKNLLAKQNLDSDALARIGFGLLLKDQPAGSIEWFNRVSPPTPDSKAGLLCAYYCLGDLENALSSFTLLTPPYSDLVSLQSMALDAYIEMGRLSEADALSKRILTQDKAISLASFPLAFMTYKQAYLDFFSSDYLQGLSLKNHGEYSRALSAFLKVLQKPHPFLLYEIGAVYYHLGQPYVAQQSLIHSIALADPDSTEFLKKALPLLAEIEEGLNLKLEAWFHYDTYFQKAPNATEGRSAYAHLLMGLGRSDLSLEQLKILEDSNLLSAADRVAYVACLVQTDQFERAQTLAKTWAENLPLNHKLDLARWLAIAGDRSLSQTILQSLPQLQEHSLSTHVALLNLYRELADYDNAETLAEKISFEDSSEGLWALAQLRAELSDPKEALQLARQAQIKDPANGAIAAFLELFEANVPAIQERLSRIESKQALMPDSPSLKVEEAHALIDLAIEQHAASPAIPLHTLSSLLRARQLLDQLALSCPRLFFLRGEASFLLDDVPATVQAFQEAIRLNTAYAQAYKYLGLVYAGLQKPDEAIKAIQSALKYAPSDAEAWSELAAYQQKHGMEREALESWQQVVKYRPRDAKAAEILSRLKNNLSEIDSRLFALELFLMENEQTKREYPQR